MRKNMSRLAVGLISMVLCLSGVACVGDTGGKTGNTTVISIMNFGGGVGTNWLTNAAARFSEKVKDQEYESGKFGVTIEVDNSTHTGIATMSTSGHNIYFDESSADVLAMSQAGWLLDLTEIITETNETINGKDISIEDRIDVDYRYSLQGADGNYYALPHYEWYPGMTYDVELFDDYNLYFASPEEAMVTEYYCALVDETGKFILDKDSKKACGPDGIYGTADDGLPSSLFELIILCARMKQLGITPFTVSGHHIDYSNYMIMGLWASLAGYDDMKTYYTFDGEADVVTGFTQQPLFPGVSDIPKPTVSRETITEDTGYLAANNVNRYYAIAFMELAERQGWFSNDSKMSTVLFTDAQYNFIFGGINNKPMMGMLLEGNYWYNESVGSGAFDEYYAYSVNKEERRLEFMTLPTSLSTTVTENNGSKPVLLDVGNSYAVINANIKNNIGLVDACKDFIKFLYTEQELQNFTKDTGCGKAKMNYDMNDYVYEGLSGFHSGVMKMKDEGNVLYQTGNNPTFLAGRGNFVLKIECPRFSPDLELGFRTIIAAIRSGHNARAIYENTGISESMWSTLYKG